MDNQAISDFMELSDGSAFPIPFVGMLLSGLPFTLENIAHGLSRQCRYNGHTNRHFSVAEHCLVLANWVEVQEWSTPVDVLTALHHDDPEIVVGDMVSPLKKEHPKFRDEEEILHKAIGMKFGTQYPHPPWLKQIDFNILVNEREQFFGDSDNVWGCDNLEPMKGIRFYNILGRFPMIMKRLWIRKHHQMMQEIFDTHRQS